VRGITVIEVGGERRMFHPDKRSRPALVIAGCLVALWGGLVLPVSGVSLSALVAAVIWFVYAAILFSGHPWVRPLSWVVVGMVATSATLAGLPPIQLVPVALTLWLALYVRKTVKARSRSENDDGKPRNQAIAR